MLIESNQVQIRITDNKEVLAHLRKAGKITKHNGVEVYEVVFNSVPYRFAIKGDPITLGANEAVAIHRANAVLPKFDGQLMPVFVKVGERDLSAGTSSLQVLTTACPFCNVDLGNREYKAKLKEHLEGGKCLEFAQSASPAPELIPELTPSEQKDLMAAEAAKFQVSIGDGERTVEQPE